MDLEKLLEKLNSDSNNLDLICDIGKKYKEVDDFDSAKRYFMLALELNPDHIPATCSLIHLLIDKGYYRDAFDTFNAAIEKYGDDEASKGTLFNALFAIYLLYNINLTESTGQDKPRNYEELFFNIGSVFMSYGLYDAASKIFESTYIISKSNVRLILNLSECYLKTDNANKAEDLLLELEKRFPDDKDILVKLSEVYCYIQDYISSKKYSKKVLELDSSNLLANNTLAYIYLIENKIDKSITIYKRLINGDHTNYMAYKNLYLAYRVGNYSNEAIEFLEDLLITKPEFAFKIRDEIDEKLKNEYLE